MTRGDFSRLTFDPTKGYSAVVMQQGRVQIDADWNEQQAIVAARIGTSLADVIGAAGAPAARPGFQITAHQGLRFVGGDGRVLIDGSSGHLSIGPGFTVEAWFELESTSASAESSDPSTIVSFATVDGGVIDLGLNQTGRLRATVSLGPPQADGALPRVDLVAAEQIDTAMFHHAVLVGDDAGVIALYLDGVLVDAAALPPPHPTALSMGSIGSQVHDRSDRFVGVIEDVRVWDVPLDYDSIIRGPSPYDRNNGHLRAWWPLNDGEGTRCANWAATGPSLDGRLTGARSLPVWGASSLRVGAGRYYVHGLLVENHQTTALPDHAWPPPSQPGRYLAYLDAWERVVTADQQPGMADVALGGRDTSLRLQTVLQVRLAELSDQVTDARGAVSEVASGWRRADSTSLAAFRHCGAPIRQNLLYRVQVQTSGPAADESRATVARLISAQRLLVDESEWDRDWVAGGHAMVFVAGEQPTAVRVESWDADALTLDVHPLPPAVRISNRCSIMPVATFAWSSDNAGASSAIASARSDGRTTVIELVDMDTLDDRLEPGGIVEVLTTDAELDGRTNPLLRIVSLDENQLVVDGSLEKDLVADDHAILIAWNDGGVPITPERHLLDGGTPVVPTEPDWPESEAVELGLVVQFAGDGNYEAGQYWQCPIRVADQSIDWPTLDGTPEFVPATGPVHARAPLAFIEWDGRVATVHDLRPIFEPLTAAADPSRAVALDRRERPHDPLPPALQSSASAAVPAHPARPGSAPSAPVDATPVEPPAPPEPVSVAQEPPPQLEEMVVPAAVLPAEIRDEEVLLVIGPDTPDGWTDVGLTVSAHPERHRRGWTIGDLLPREVEHSVGLVSVEDEVYFLDPSGTISAFAEGAWTEIGHFTPRWGFAAVELDGWIHIIGGRTEAGPVDTHERFHPARRLIETGLAPMPVPCWDAAAARIGDAIHVIGGTVGRRKAIATHRRYADGAWTALEDAPKPRTQTGLFSDGTRLIMPGGAARLLWWWRASRTVWSYDVAAKTWRRERSLRRPRRQHAVAGVGTAAVAIAGRSWCGLPLRSVLELDAATGRWERIGRLPERSTRLAATTRERTVWAGGGRQGRRWSRMILTSTIPAEIRVLVPDPQAFEGGDSPDDPPETPWAEYC